MENKISIFILGILLISLASVSAAQESLGVYEKDDCVNLIQLCGDCTYNNITSIILPNTTRLILDIEMTQRGSEFNYTFCLTNEIGIYLVNGLGDLAGVDTVWAYEIEVTENGNERPGDTVIVLFSILFLIILASLTALILYTLAHTVEKDFDVKDLIFNISAYLVLWGVYVLGKEYIGNNFINTFLEWLINVGAITNVIFPLIIFVISITIWKWREELEGKF